MRPRFGFYTSINCNIASSAYCRVHLADNRNQLRLSQPKVRNHGNDFLCLAAVAQQNHHVARGNYAQVAMQRIQWVEIKRNQANRAKGCGNLSGHEARLAHTAHNHFGLALLQNFDCLIDACRVQSIGSRGNGSGFMQQGLDNIVCIGAL